MDRPIGTLGASNIGALFTKQGLKAKSAHSKAFELAKELVNGYRKNLTTISMAHGLFNEEEAFNVVVKPNFPKAKYHSNKSYQIEGDFWATPDAVVEGECVIDIKCPYHIDTYKANISNPKAGYIAQVMTQMLACNVDKGYLVYYLTSCDIDEFGNKKELDIDIKKRVAIIPIDRDDNFIEMIKERAKGLLEMRDVIYSHIKDVPIINDADFYDMYDSYKITRLKTKSNLLAWEGKIIRNREFYYVTEKL